MVKACLPIVVGKAVDQQSVRRRAARLDAQAAIGRLMAGTGRKHLTGADFAAKCPRDLVERYHSTRTARTDVYFFTVCLPKRSVLSRSALTIASGWLPTRSSST